MSEFFKRIFELVVAAWQARVYEIDEAWIAEHESYLDLINDEQNHY